MPASAAPSLLDGDRLAAVRRYQILDTPAAGEFDSFARAAATVCCTPIATVGIVDADRVWFAASRGLGGVTQVGVEPGLCASAFSANGPYVVNDACADPRTLDHPLVRGPLGLRFYAAAPIVSADGYHLGTVAAIDAAPRQPTEMQTTMLGHLADIVAGHLELRLTALTAERSERRLREQAARRAASAAALASRIHEAAEAHRGVEHPATCQLGGARHACPASPDLKIADPWGDSAWGCAKHVEEAIVHVPVGVPGQRGARRPRRLHATTLTGPGRQPYRGGRATGQPVGEGDRAATTRNCSPSVPVRSP